MPHVKAAAAAAAISLGHATCGRPPLLWMGVRAATTAVLSQTTENEYAGYGMHVVPRHSDRSTGGRRPANSTRCGCAAAAD